MVGVLFAGVLNSKIVHAKGESDGSPLVVPESRDKGALAISFGVYPLLENFLGQETCLVKSVHSPLDLDVDLSVFFCFLFQVVSLNKIFRQVAELEPHVFKTLHWRVEVEILDVDCQEFCSWRGYYTVE